LDNAKVEQWVGLGLLFFSLVWYFLVTNFIEVPSSVEEGPDSRTFPLFFGFLLGTFSLLLIVRSIVQGGFKKKAVTSDVSRENFLAEFRCAAWMLGCLFFYGYVMSLFGFMLATLVSVLLILVGALKVYRPKQLIAITLGISIGTYLIFGKLLGIYLPLGQLLDIGM
jgi:hypothetical protein